MLKRAPAEEREAKRAAKEAERAAEDAAREARRRAQARERLRKEFFLTPAGLARKAYEHGDRVFQYSLDVRQTQTVHVPMVGAYSVPKATTDPSDILNSVCDEGWSLVNGSFVFLETGSESRDKFLASGQHIAVSGTVVGYYLFERCEENKQKTVDPWEVASL